LSASSTGETPTTRARPSRCRSNGCGRCWRGRSRSRASCESVVGSRPPYNRAVRRRLLNLLTGLSLLLCVATVGSLFRSFWRIDSVRHLRIYGEGGAVKSQQWQIWQSAGGASVNWFGCEWGDGYSPPQGEWWDFNTGSNVTEPFARLTRFGTESPAIYQDRKRVWGRQIDFPIWIAAISFGLLPAGRFYLYSAASIRRASAPAADTTSAPRRGGVPSAAPSPPPPRLPPFPHPRLIRRPTRLDRRLRPPLHPWPRLRRPLGFPRRRVHHRHHDHGEQETYLTARALAEMVGVRVGG
jgi:hypothetical protein